MLKKIWNYGTSTPIQRVGIIILTIGLVSLISWMIKEELDLGDIFNSYSFPRSYDSFFFHLYFYFIPLGLLMSWGYIFLLKTKEWVINGYIYKKPTSPKPKFTYTSPKKNLHFKNNSEAFKFAMNLYATNYTTNQMYFGIVKDIILLNDTKYQFLVQLADQNRTVLVNGYNDKHANRISMGNLVYWGYVDKTESNTLGIEAVGHILATLHPEYNPNDFRWSIKENLTNK